MKRDWREPEKLSIEDGRKILGEEAKENSVVAVVTGYLAFHNFVYSITDSSQSFTHYGNLKFPVTPGWPDITAIIRPEGRLFAIEAKRPGKHNGLRYKQACMLLEMHKSGALIVVARSVDCVIEVRKTGLAREEDLAAIEARIAEGPKKDLKGAARSKYTAKVVKAANCWQVRKRKRK